MGCTLALDGPIITSQAKTLHTFAEEEAQSVMARYMRDVRRYPRLTLEQEKHLAQQIDDGRCLWRTTLLAHLLHVPELLSSRRRVRRGTVCIADLVTPDDEPSRAALVATLDHLHQLCRQMRQLVQRERHHRAVAEAPRTVRALRAEMHTLLHPWSWHPALISQAWTRLEAAMGVPSSGQQRRYAARCVFTLGYGMPELRVLWQSLQDLHAHVEQAKQEMVTRNLRLVIRMAREFRHTTMSFEELIQEGNIGLMRAVDKFDYRRNVKFSTYAVWWIKQAMRRAMLQQSSQIRIPEYMCDAVSRVHKARAVLTEERDSPPTAKDIARYLGMPLERVERSEALVQAPISLDHPRTDGATRALRETLPDTRTRSIQERLEQDALQEHIQRTLEQLTPREADIIRRRFGLQGQPEETLRQIGLDLHLSHERVRQLAAGALATLKAQGMTLRDFVESDPEPGVRASYEAVTAVSEQGRDHEAHTSRKDDVGLEGKRQA